MGVVLRVRAPNLSSSSCCLPSSSRLASPSSSRHVSVKASPGIFPERPLVCRFKRAGVVVRAAESPGPVKEEAMKEEAKKEQEMRDDRIGDYCSIEERAGRRTLGELEADFLAALQSFYYDGKPMMSNEEFDNLKEELMWEGSSVVMLSGDEHRFMEASLAYQKRKPIMSDDEYDTLKMKLKQQGSVVAIQGPRCIIRSKRVVSDASVDYLKMTLLNTPAALIALGLVFFLDDLTGFEITYLIELPEPYSFLFTWFGVLPFTFFLAQSLTNIVFKNILILKGQCPNCGAGITSFFGTILTVESGGPINTAKCENCGSKLNIKCNSRIIELDPTPDPPKKGKDNAAAKSAA